jgi:hypothetical protein
MGIADAMQTDKPRAASTVLAVRDCRSRALGAAHTDECLGSVKLVECALAISQSHHAEAA